MIDGKKSFRIYLANEDEVKEFREFLVRNKGEESALEEGFLKPATLYEVSVELKVRYLELHGWCSHVGYPASKKYQNDLKEFIFWYENEYLGFKDVEIIKHIPHASTLFPEDYEEINLQIMFGGDYKKQNYKLSDLFVDDLFKNIKGVEVKAKYSRLYCDVERFKDDSKEEMATIGFGYIYSKNIYNSRPYFRHIVLGTKDICDEIDNYYDEHHKRLTAETKRILKEGKKVLILDLHSFSDELATLLGKKGPFPDVCIGLNGDNYDQRVLNTIIKRIEKKGYSYRINFPYEGSIIPYGLTKKELKNVSSIMIEVNKRIYL